MLFRLLLVLLAAVAAFGPATPAGAAEVDWSGRTLPAGVSERELSVDGFRTRVLEAGPKDAREAVVFVHGFPGSGVDFAHLAGGVGPSGRAISFDMAGLGRADDPEVGPYTVDEQAAYLGRALELLGVDKVHLVLHDFGGPYGLQWAKANPERLESVVLLNTGIFTNYAGHAEAYVFNVPGLGEAYLAQPREYFSASIQKGQPRPLPQSFVDRMYDDLDPGTRAAALKLYRSIRDPNGLGRAQAEVLRRKRRPALVVWGASDPYIPVYVAYEQEKAFPGARVELLDSGHWPFVDNVDKVDALVLPFLRDVLGRGERASGEARPQSTPRRGLRIRVGAVKARRKRPLRPLICASGGRVEDVRALLYQRRRGRNLRISASTRVRRLEGCRRVALRVHRRRGVRRGTYRLVARGGRGELAVRTLRVR